MRSDKRSLSRGQIKETHERNVEHMRIKEHDLDLVASDVETIRHTLDSLEFSGTTEGTDEVENTFMRAEDVTVDVFERKDQDLEEIHHEAESHQVDLQERTDLSETDRERIADAVAKLDTSESVNELSRAQQAAASDIEFLSGQIERAREAKAESDKLQDEYQSRVKSLRR